LQDLSSAESDPAKTDEDEETVIMDTKLQIIEIFKVMCCIHLYKYVSYMYV
jgi:hypothetical protein